MRRKNSSHHQLRMRIPRDVLPRARGKRIVVPVGDEVVRKTVGARAEVVTISLKTRDPVEAKRRHAAALAHLEAFWQALRQGPTPLTQRQVVSLAGEVYRSMADRLAEEPGSSATWSTLIKISEAAKAGQFGAGQLLIGASLERRRRASLDQWFGPTVDEILSKRSLVIDDDSRERLLLEVANATIDAARKLKRNAESDYSPDPAASRFPPWNQSVPTSAAVPGQSLVGLLEAWWREAKALGRSQSTHESYSRTVKQFVTLIGHDDASRITPEDVVAYKDARLVAINPRSGKFISPKTIKDTDLAGLKALFGWAVRNKLMASNPARDITLGRRVRQETRPKDFTPDEAKAILAHAAAVRRGKESPKTYAAKRWAPWLCAYTGARIGEIVQLRKQDVRRDGDQWIITITPDAGPVKTKMAREVPLHRHLTEMGFPDFVDAAQDGYLFVNVKRGGDVVGPLQGVKNRVAEFVREVVPDPGVAPSHGWRHLFKTIGVDVGVQERILDAICGHVPATVGGRYGQVTIKAKADAIARFPRFTTE